MLSKNNILQCPSRQMENQSLILLTSSPRNNENAICSLSAPPSRITRWQIMKFFKCFSEGNHNTPTTVWTGRAGHLSASLFLFFSSILPRGWSPSKVQHVPTPYRCMVPTIVRNSPISAIPAKIRVELALISPRWEACKFRRVSTVTPTSQHTMIKPIVRAQQQLLPPIQLVRISPPCT